MLTPVQAKFSDHAAQIYSSNTALLNRYSQAYLFALNMNVLSETYYYLLKIPKARVMNENTIFLVSYHEIKGEILINKA